MMATLELHGMSFHAYHGCLPKEHEFGNRFLVDFSCEYDIGRAARSDELSDTLDFNEIYRLVDAEMRIKSQLLEHLARRIADRIQAEHPEIEHLEVKVMKLDPPLAGPAAWSAVTVKR